MRARKKNPKSDTFHAVIDVAREIVSVLDKHNSIAIQLKGILLFHYDQPLV